MPFTVGKHKRQKHNKKRWNQWTDCLSYTNRIQFHVFQEFFLIQTDYSFIENILYKKKIRSVFHVLKLNINTKYTIFAGKFSYFDRLFESKSQKNLVILKNDMKVIIKFSIISFHCSLYNINCVLKSIESKRIQLNIQIKLQTKTFRWLKLVSLIQNAQIHQTWGNVWWKM